MALLNFDASTVEPAESLDAVPMGEYLSIIDQSDLVPTKAGNGIMLELRINIIDGPYKERKIWTRLNVQNTNERAQQFGQRQLSQLCHAVGKIQVGDSTELHMIPFIAKIGFQRDDNTRNEVKDFKPASGQATTATTSRPAFNAPRASAPAAPAQAPAFAQQPAATAGNSAKPAWAR